MRPASVLVLLLAVPPAAAQQGTLRPLLPAAGMAAEGLTLAQALALAERVQPAVVQASTQQTAADAARRTAIGQWLPNVNGTSTYGTLFSENARPDPITGIPVVAGSSLNSVSFGLNANLLLFTGFQRGANTRAAGAQVTAAEAGLVSTRFQVRLTTASQFFTALASEALVRVREASVTRGEEQLRAASARLQAGSATRSDSLRSLVQLGNAQADLAAARAALVAAQASLAALVGRDLPVRAVDDSAYDRFPAREELELLAAAAVEEAPQVRTSEAQARAAGEQLRALRAQYWPTLTLNGNTSWNGNNRLNDYQLFNQRQLSLVLTWPLFNRFQREAGIANQAAQRDLAEAQAADARRQVRATLAGQIAQADAAGTRLTIARTSVEAAREDLRVQQARYRLGAATILDVLTSQEALTQAEVNEVTARFDFLRAKAQVEAVLGRSL